MKNHLLILLFGTLALMAATMTSCKEDTTEPADEPREYSIGVTALPGGRAEATVGGAAVSKAQEGVRITLSATPDDGYTFRRWVVESGGVVLPDETSNQVTFSMPAENVSVKAEFAEEIVNVFDKITDPVFHHFCINYLELDTNGDGILSLEEAAAVKKLNVSELDKLLGTPIESLAGIEYFTSLTYLTCYGNAITQIDLSKNTELTYLHVATNRLTDLDVTKNTKLVELYFSRNAITQIDLSKCPDLEILQYTGCSELTSLDVSKNTKLTNVRGESCPKITALDFSNNPALVELNCAAGGLTSLNVSNCKALKTLHSLSNRLTSLDVTKNTALETFTCDHNLLTSIDISNCTSLEYFMCQNNRMTELDATAMSNPNGFDLGCGVQTTDGTTPQTLTLTLREDQKQRWELYMVPYDDMNANVTLAGGSADVFVSITDPVFKEYCKRYDSDQDGKLSLQEAAAVTDLTVPNMGIASLAGLEYFPGIKTLVCNNNKLVSLNVAYNPVLVDLVCNDNKLTELILTAGLSGGDVLASVSCQNNQLTKLSVAGCRQLQTLNCQNNQLTEINLWRTSALTRINCANNKLTVLDFYYTTALTTLMCQNNEFKTLDLSNMRSLVSVMCNNNPMTSLNISGCTALMGLMAYENRLKTLDASYMNNPTGYNIFCGNQTSDGTTPQTLTLTLRAEQKPHWENNMKSSSMNNNVVLAD